MDVAFHADAVVPVDEVRLAVEVLRKKDVVVAREALAAAVVVVNRDAAVGPHRELEELDVRRVAVANVVLHLGGVRLVVDVNCFRAAVPVPPTIFTRASV